MTSKPFSGADATGGGGRSLFSDLRDNIDNDEQPDPELAVDEQNLREEFRDYDLESNMDGGRSRMTLDSAPDAARRMRSGSPHHGIRGRNRNRWQPQDDEEEEENDVPESLLMERNETDGVGGLGSGIARPSRHAEQPLLAGKASQKGRGHWDASRSARNPPRNSRPGPPSNRFPANPVAPGVPTSSARDKAAWRWVNVTNLDQFMLDVYNYYDGCGIWCILTDRALHLL